MERMPVYIVDYAYGFHADRCEVDYVSKLRSEAALRAFKKFPHAYIVLSAGMKEATGDCGPLASMMEDFLVAHSVAKEKILRNPLGHDTLSESEAAYELMRKRGLGKVICATSRYHATRVWCIWFFRFGITPLLYTTKLKPSSHEAWREIQKVPQDIVRALFSRFKNKK